MKDFQDYRTTVPYPKRADFITVYGYAHGECVFSYNGNEWDAMADKPTTAAVIEKDLNSDAYLHARKEFYEDDRKKLKEFKQDIFDEFGVTGHPKAEEVYSLAWERGHSVGLSEVYNEFSELVVLIQ